MHTMASLQADSEATAIVPTSAVSPAWVLFVPVVVLVGYAIDIEYGPHQEEGHVATAALLSIGLALACALVAIVTGRSSWPRTRRSGALMIGAVGVALAIQFCLGLRSAPVPNLRITDSSELQAYLSGVGFAAVLAGGLLASRPFLERATMPIVVIAFFALGTWIIQHTRPGIDVLVYQRDASAALLHGTNPYAMTFADPYEGQRPQWFGSGLAHDGRLWFGYPYMPWCLWMDLPGQLIAGDVRCAHLAALAVGGLLIGYARGTPVSFGAAALVLFMSRTMLVVCLAWTEPFVVLPLAGVLLCATRAPRWTPWVLGLFLASKQYVPLCAPLMLLLCPRPWKIRDVLVFAGKALIVAAIVTLPLVLWNPRAFWHSAVTVQLMAPFRPDALSFLASGADPAHPPSAVWAFVAMAATMGLSLWRAPRNAAGFCGAVAFSFLTFFAFNKQAFANYYYFVIAAACCAVAATTIDHSSGAAPAVAGGTG
jgi:hypothetical protein